MCGIAGFFFRHAAQTYVPELLILDMITAIAHRGPDDAQHWIDTEAGIALGHRRLSIIDLSPAGRQPMTSANGRFVVVYNGEIYNHRALRAELESLGVAPEWRGHSDTEVLLAAIVHWGLEGALQRANGMFALALWDHKTRDLTLARDRFGEKPLYYGAMSGTFLFGSELKALTKHPAFQKNLNRDALALYLRHNYIPTSHSIWLDIHKLPQAHYLVVSDGGRTISKPICYWDFGEMAIRRQHAVRPNTPELVDELDMLLRDAVLKRMDADVPMGAFLSGGIDSSVIVALMQAQSSRPVRTFSMGFHEKAYNEAEHGKAVAKHLGTDHTELYVTPQDALDVVPRLPMIWDEPFADSSQIPTLLLSELTRRHVTVSLSGDAGDELFGGYNRYFQATAIRKHVAGLPRGLRRIGAGLMAQSLFGTILSAVNSALPSGYRQMALKERLPKLANMLKAESDNEVYHSLVSHWEQPDALVLGAREPDTLLTQNAFPTLDFPHRMMALDTLTYLPDDILVKVDRASMAVSLEARVPFLDHRVAEFAWSLPLEAKIRGGIGKHLLRQVLHCYVPPALVDRPKMGFGVPINDWLRGPLRDWANDLLDPSRLHQEGVLNSKQIVGAWQDHVTGKRNLPYHIWDILMFQAWHQEHMA
jgi:asparagine synthase (glutamine-hydrolysing)